MKNFYKQTIMHYPWAAELLDLNWIFDACIEALEPEEGLDFLRKLET